MLPGIDPKVDVAFKKVFGSEPWRHLTVSLINAVLSPVRWGRMVDLELLNPFTQLRVGRPTGTAGLLVVLPQERRGTRRGRAPRAT